MERSRTGRVRPADRSTHGAGAPHHRGADRLSIARAALTRGSHRALLSASGQSRPATGRTTKMTKTRKLHPAIEAALAAADTEALRSVDEAADDAGNVDDPEQAEDEV